MTWNYTTVLNIAFLLLAGFSIWRAGRTDGFRMLRMMDEPIHAHPAGEYA